MIQPAACLRLWFLPILGPLLMALPLGCRRAGPPPEEKPPPAPVKIESARLLPVGEWSQLLGTSQPPLGRFARITVPVEGRVQKILVHDAAGKAPAEGQAVHQGDVILELDDRIIREQKAQAEYDQKLSQLEVTRLEALAGTGSGGAQPLVSPVELNKARIMLQNATSRLKGLDEQLRLYTLRAPINGRLGRVQVVPGQTLAVGTTVVDVTDIRDQIDVLCFVPPRSANRLKLTDQPARILRVGEEALGDQGANPEGKIIFIADQGEPDTGNFAVKVRFPNNDLRLRANVVVQLQVLTTPDRPALAIPEAALMMDTDPPQVVVVEDLKTVKVEGKDAQLGQARRLQARVGIRDPVRHLVEILGLEDPEKPKDHFSVKDAVYVVEGAHGLRSGDVVKVEQHEEEAEAAPKP